MYILECASCSSYYYEWTPALGANWCGQVADDAVIVVVSLHTHELQCSVSSTNLTVWPVWIAVYVSVCVCVCMCACYVNFYSSSLTYLCGFFNEVSPDFSWVANRTLSAVQWTLSAGAYSTPNNTYVISLGVATNDYCLMLAMPNPLPPCTNLHSALSLTQHSN